jgi:hypothetical protein
MCRQQSSSDNCCQAEIVSVAAKPMPKPNPRHVWCGFSVETEAHSLVGSLSSWRCRKG